MRCIIQYIFIFCFFAVIGQTKSDSLRTHLLTKNFSNGIIIFQDNHYIILTSKSNIESYNKRRPFPKNQYKKFSLTNSTDFYSYCKKAGFSPLVDNMTAEFIQTDECSLIQKTDNKNINQIWSEDLSDINLVHFKFYVGNHFLLDFFTKSYLYRRPGT